MSRACHVYTEPTRQTVGAYLEQWLSAQQSRLRPSTHESYRRVLRAHVTPAIGGVPLTRLTATALDDLYARLLRDGRCDGTGGLSARTVRYTHTIIRRTLADAVRKGLLARNVADLADPPSATEAKAPTMRTWTADELAAFLKHVSEDRLFAAWMTAASTGARRGEVLGARWRDLDLVGRRWGIVQTVIESGVSRPKSGRSRSVALDAGTVDTLRAHRKAQAAERLALGPAYVDSDLVFCREDGRRCGHGRSRGHSTAMLLRPSCPASGFTTCATRGPRSPCRPACIRRSSASGSATPRSPSRWTRTVTSARACSRTPPRRWRRSCGRGRAKRLPGSRARIPCLPL